MGEYITTLKEQIDFLKNEEHFLRKDISEKYEMTKSVFRNYLSPVFNLQNDM